MKAARKSRNFSQRKEREAVLPRSGQEEILRDWLNYLLDPAFSTALRSSDTNARLHRVRQEIARLKGMEGCFVDGDGSFYTGKAVASLEEEEKHLLSEKGSRTYECRFFGRRGGKELGNVDVAERFGISIFITRSLRPTENPYDVLQTDLATRKVSVTSKAIQMRVRRLEGKIRAGQHMTWHQILQEQYRCYKYLSRMNLWLSRFTGFAPAGYLKKCLTLTRREMNMLRSLVARAEPTRVVGHHSLGPRTEARSTHRSLATAGVSKYFL